VRTSEWWDKRVEIGEQNYFQQMAKFATPDPQLYDICYILDNGERIRL
jgi:hypothetical protein